MDLDVVFLGTSGSMPTAQRAPGRHARPPRRRAAALRLRRGDAAPAAALRRRARRPPRGLPHALPRRPLPRPARDAEDVRAPRPRAAADDLRAAGPRRAHRLAAADLRQAHVPVRRGRASSPAMCSPRDGYELRTFAVAHGRAAVGYALVEAERPGRFDVEAADRARRPGRPGARRAPAGRAGDARRRQRGDADEVLGPPRAGRTIVLSGDTAPTSRSSTRRSGADVLVHEATFCEDERERARETEHSTAARGGAGRARGRRQAARADAPLDPLLRPRRRARGAGGLPGHGRAARLRRHRGAVPERGAPALVKRGARATAG